MTNPNPLPDNFQQTINESAQLLQQNRPGEAAARLEPLHQLAPTHPDIAINLGGAFILQRKWSRAVRVLTKAAEANPENAMLWVNLGAAQLGNLQTAGPQQQARAIRAYERALQIDPVAPNVHYHLGLIYQDQGNFDRAIAMFQRALEVRPSDSDARYWIDKLTSLNAAEQNNSSDATRSSPSSPKDNHAHQASANGEQS